MDRVPPGFPFSLGGTYVTEARGSIGHARLGRLDGSEDGFSRALGYDANRVHRRSATTAVTLEDRRGTTTAVALEDWWSAAAAVALEVMECSRKPSRRHHRPGRWSEETACLVHPHT